jgi:hypothetical protein
MTKVIVAAALLLASVGFAQAQTGSSCVYPQPPRSIPDGNTATYDEMVEAHKTIRQYDADVRTYAVCLELELKSLVESQGVDDARRQELEAMYASRNNAAIDQVQAVVDAFNQQLRIYRAREQEQEQD